MLQNVDDAQGSIYDFANFYNKTPRHFLLSQSIVI